MSNNLVYIKIEDGYDEHAGKFDIYSPIIYNDLDNFDDLDNILQIDKKTRIVCTSWMNPSEYHTVDTNIKYLINEITGYGYLYQGEKKFFNRAIDLFIKKELEYLI
jgi:hypothetical protein